MAKPIGQRSTKASPTKAVWQIADDMLMAAAKNGYSITRGLVLKECAKQGISKNTARTQFQRWVEAHTEANTPELAHLLRKDND